jgi:transglycosylase-like protein with SLT domain
LLQFLRVFALGLAGLAAAVSPITSHPAQPAPVRPAALFLAEENQTSLQMSDAYTRGQELAAAQADAQQRAAQEAAAEAAAAAAAAQAQRAAQPVQTGPAPAAPAAVNYGSGTVQDIIRQAFAPYGQTAVDWGLRVAKCESGYNPRAYNPAGPYYGLFQFLMSTFKNTPYGGGDIYDPMTNAKAAAWKYSQGGAGAWGCN